MKPHLDDFLKKKLEQREFEFQDAYWADALDLIEADEKGKRRGFWFLLLAGLVLLTGLGYATYAPYMQHLNDSSNGNQPIAVENINKNADLDRPTTNDEATTITKNQFDQIENKKTEIANNRVDQPKKQATNSTVNTEFPKPKLHTSINTSIGNTPTDTNGFTERKEVAEAATPITTATTTSSSSNLSRISDVLLSDFTTNKTIQNPVTPTEELQDLTPIIGLQVQDIQTLVNEDLAELPATVPTWDTPDNFDHLYKNNPFSVGFRAGSLMYLSLPNGQIGYTVGLVGKYKINERLAFNTDVLYHVRRHQFNAISQANVIEYSFGRTESVQTLRPSELHSFEVPLYLSVGFGKLNKTEGFDFNQTKRYLKHTFDIGVAPTILYGVKGALEVENSDLLQEGWIKTDAYQKIYASAIVGYNYNIRDYFSVGIRARYAVGGIIDNNFEFPQGVEIAQPDKLYFELNAKFLLF